MTRAAVRPELLRWARERAGIGDSGELLGRFPKLAEWETGEAHPTLKQLEAFADAVHVPVGYLFLAAPPDEPLPIPDFRTHDGRGVRSASPYLLDTNIFIQAKNLHSGFDFRPAFWEWLVAQNAAGRVASIDKVGDELQAGGDDLSNWATARGRSFFLPPDDSVVPALTRVSGWATSQIYEAAAIATFLQVADYWLVAHALAHNFVVVTHEVPSDSTRKIKIPNACIGLGLPCIGPYEMLRRERARFILGSTSGAA